MGVQGLWELLAPVGRRVSVETLSGKRLAIDASIWLVQFMKAMRDEKGEMVRNAHLLGFFRRICKLLFLRTKPVFVFDGGTPALKRRTIVARRRHRDNAQAKIRKTAEKLLLNHLRTRKLEELAKEIASGKEKDRSKGKQVIGDSDASMEKGPERNVTDTRTYSQESLDQLLAASLAAEENGDFIGNASTSMGGNLSEEEDDGDENEEMILPLMHSKVDPTVLAALPPSMQLDLLVQMRERLMAENRQKYQKVKKTPTKFSELQIQSYLKTVAFRREIDEVQKSAAGRGVGGMQASRIASEPNREFIFSSSFTGDKRMEVLPFIDKHSELTRTLTSAGVEESGVAEHQTPGKEPASSASVDGVSSSSQFHSVIGTGGDEHTKDFNYDVETYIDERGCVRVSRVRALGIRMTRDLQRNLDLMKEFELEKQNENAWTDMEAAGNHNTPGSMKVLQENNHALEVSTDDRASNETSNFIERTDRPSTQERKNHLSHEQSTQGGKTSIEISFFEDDAEANGTDVDDLFSHLVTGSSKFTTESVPFSKQSSEISSDCVLGEGVLQEESFRNDAGEKQPALVDESICDEGEVDWEEGVCQVSMNSSPCPSGHKKTVSKGCLEEDADIQEAIRRSLEDITEEKSIFPSSVRKVVEPYAGMVHYPNIPLENGGSRSQTSYEAVEESERLETGYQRDNLQINDFPDKQSVSSIKLGVETDGKSMKKDKDGEAYQTCNHAVSSHGVCKDRSIYMETPPSNTAALLPMEAPITGEEQCLHNPKEGKSLASCAECTVDSPSVISHTTPKGSTSDLTDAILADGHQIDSQASHSHHSYELENGYSDFQGTFTAKYGTESGREQEPIVTNIHSIDPDEGEHNRDKAIGNQNLGFEAETLQTSLDEEMLLLQKERMDLGDEQRKLERSAESVSSEMFAECQELLQMFGLPYIIAPMEAEAQCAYMELMNLVDGVVTDDSDVFLFGARSVYKNIFDDRKYVETYFMKDMESELGLTREKLIRMALLLGSDYTEGISGIGIVNAIEVVHAFPEEDGLRKFREWLESPDPAIFGKLYAYTGNSSWKRSAEVRNIHEDDSANNLDDFAADEGVSGGCGDKPSADNLSNVKQIFMDKHRNVSKNWHFPSSFPSELVVGAYASPQVDKSTEPFSWGKPDLFVLRKLCWERFGWSNQKADELLIPVLKEYNKHETQLRLEAFYTFNERFAKIRSQRIKKAVKGIVGHQASELMEDFPQEGSKSRKRRKASPTVTEENMSEKCTNVVNDGAAEFENNAPERKAPNQPQKRKTVSQLKQSAVRHSEPSTTVRRMRNGRGRGSGRGRGRGPGRKTATPNLESTEASSSDRDDQDNEEMQVDQTKESFQLRRSARPRKQVEYAAKDLETDSPGCSSKQSDEDSTGERAVDLEPFSNPGTVRNEHALNNRNQSLEDSVADNSSKDNLFSRGGFGRDDAEEQNHARNQGLEDPIADNSSEDYLFSGGGFCADDSDNHNTNPIQSFLSTERASDELLHGSKIDSCEASQSLNVEHFPGNNHPSNVVDEALWENQHEGQKDGGSRISTPQMMGQTDVVVDEPAVQAGLSAMPSLRRKRRKT